MTLAPSDVSTTEVHGPGRLDRDAPPSEPVVERGAVRPEIQALRAIAVMLVVTYHLWPAQVPGGYVGVDVFFAISGFLITGQLLREVERSGTVSLRSFWAKRARRLLPASLVVLLASAVITFLWVPTTNWSPFFREITASALYFENWRLAWDSVDYLAAENAASPAQHYWSLSVEEQFYALWPLLVVAALLIVRAVPRVARQDSVVAVLGVVTLGSLAFSIVETAANQPRAYFLTQTRAWEFGLGALLAVVAANPPTRRRTLRSTVSWAALAVITATGLIYTDATRFPGYLALVPVGATLVVIWAGAPRKRWSPMTVLGLPPVQFLGDVSYSLYLWHWPLIIAVPAITGTPMGHGARIGVLAASIALAWLTKVFVEDPVRTNRGLARKPPSWTYGAALAGMFVIVALAGYGGWEAGERADAARAETLALLDDGADCLGAAALDPANQPCVNPDLDGVMIPNPAEFADDVNPLRATPESCPQVDNERPSSRQRGLFRDLADSGAELCVFGDRHSETRVALVGDSHAKQMSVAMVAIAEARGWELDVLTTAGCAFATTDAEMPAEDADACREWNEAVLSFVTQRGYDAVVVTQRHERLFVGEAGEDGRDAAVRGITETFQQLVDSGVHVVTVRDNPEAYRELPTCLTDNGPEGAGECDFTRSDGLGFDAQEVAAEAFGPEDLTRIDLSDFYCDDTTCFTVVGAVSIYLDSHHVSTPYVTTLAPYLAEQLPEDF